MLPLELCYINQPLRKLEVVKTSQSIVTLLHACVCSRKCCFWGIVNVKLAADQLTETKACLHIYHGIKCDILTTFK